MRWKLMAPLFFFGARKAYDQYVDYMDARTRRRALLIGAGVAGGVIGLAAVPYLIRFVRGAVSGTGMSPQQVAGGPSASSSRPASYGQSTSL